MPAAEYVVATPQARPVRSMKKERRYVKDGSGRCHVFFVSIDGRMLVDMYQHGWIGLSYVSDPGHCQSKILLL